MQQIINRQNFTSQDNFIDNIKSSHSGLKYHIITYGCQMNERDSENIKGMLENLEYIETENKEDADIIIFNTCAVRENAEDRFFGNIGALKQLSEKKENLILCVCGCMMQQEHIVERLIEKHKYVSIIFGTHNIYKFPQLLYNYLENSPKTTLVDVFDKEGNIIEGLPSARKYSFKGLVNITFGCNNFCTYCIVPYTRGRERSRDKNDILDEIRLMSKSGVKEVMLLGQNVNSYGKTFEEKYSFSDLLYDIDKIDGIERIRFMTSHPKDISDDLIHAIGDLKSVCENLHLPVQSGSNEILKKMNRHYTREDYLKKIDKIKNTVPGITFSTDLIVGFPGETRKDFEDTLDIVKQVEYSNCFIFHYSPRTGTPAAKMENNISEEEKKYRFDTLLNATNDISNKINKVYLGNTEKVLVEGYSKNNQDTYTGRNRKNALINFTSDKNQIGELVDVKITSTNSFSLFGHQI